MIICRLRKLIVLWVMGLLLYPAWGFGEQPLNVRHGLTGHAFQFPRDLYAHNDYHIEWWYVNGNLEGEDGHQYGYHSVFFRVSLKSLKALQPSNPSVTQWDNDHLYFANMALSDFHNNAFYFYERLNRRGPGLAGAREDRLEVWNENWKLAKQGTGFRLQALEQETGFDLNLIPRKKPVVHGNGADRSKWTISEDAPNYFSYTRLKTTGSVWVQGREIKVSGFSWMDRVFGKKLLVPEQKGWDRFMVRLDNGAELLLFFIRNRDGKVDPRSGGTWVDAHNKSTHLALEQIQFKSTGTWTSKKSRATYPSGWRLQLPGKKIDLEIIPEMPDQELHLMRSLSNAHWAGGVDVRGTYEGKPVEGKGHVELVGYGGDLAQVLPQ